MRRRMAAVFIATALAPGLGLAAPVDPKARYEELVAAYAAGYRAVAVAEIGTLDEDALRSGAESLAGQPPKILLAALMMHTDRRLLERAGADTIETLAACESADEEPAWRAAQHLMLDPGGIDYARRWMIAMALQDRWDGCFEDAQRWIDAGARAFPADPEVLLTRGTLYELIATLPSRQPRLIPVAGSRGRQRHLAATAQRLHLLNQARHSLERAAAADPAKDAARVRLGRVLWRLGKADGARAAFERVIARNADDASVHLARMFLARVLEEAGRHDDALRQYRAAFALEPTSQGAAIGLSDALQLAGQPEAARAAVEAALSLAGRRQPPQSLWQYTFGDSEQAPALLERLREDIAP